MNNSENCVEVVVSIFTVANGNLKTLISYEENDNLPYLVRGVIKEPCEIVKKVREIVRSKTKIDNVDIFLSNVYGKTSKMGDRLVSLSYIAITSDMELTLDNSWIDLDNIPLVFAYDYKEILGDSINKFKEMALNDEVIKRLFDNKFTMPELQKIYEFILGVKFDRRNFHRKILSDKKIIETGDKRLFEGRKKAKVYKYQ